MDAANVEFFDNMYLGKDRNQQEGRAMRAEIVRLTVEQAPAEAFRALVKTGWHYSFSDGWTTEHCAVEFWDCDDNPLPTEHIVKT
ncbi:hypothetical protein F52700_3596 [Fusarium sp. NRRL 52700]|nr:hypothetical protein F52700_3596 [Fusarium sp. NRRL 52700]